MSYQKLCSLLPALAVVLIFITGCQPAPVRSGELASPPPVSETPPANNDPISIAAVGDIMMGSTFPNETRMPPNDGADLLKDVTPILMAADIAFGNLEGPLTDSGVSSKCGPRSTRCFAFRVPTRYGRYLKEAGFDVMSLANNHAGDFGDSGRASTRSTLDALGIKHAGSDRGQNSTTVLNVKGRRVAFIGFGHNNIVPNLNDLDLAARLVRDARASADLVVVSFHGGAEGTDKQHVPYGTEIFVGEARGNLRAFSRTVIDAGAHLVLGHGPHVLRGIELYKGHLIAYSLGNFCTYGWFQLAGETALSTILEVEIDGSGKFRSGKLHAVRQEGRGIPVLDPTGQALRVIRSLSEADFGPAAPKVSDDGSISLR